VTGLSDSDSVPRNSEDPLAVVVTAATTNAGVDAHVPVTLRLMADWSWRLLVVGVVGWFLIQLLARLQFLVIALFVGLVVTALVLPLVRAFRRRIPKALAVALGLLILLIGVLGIFAFIGGSVAGEWSSLASQFRDGIGKIEIWGQQGPLHLRPATITGWYDSARIWLSGNGSTIIARTLSGAGTVLEVLTGLALAVFSSVFFLIGGEGIWQWVVSLTPRKSHAVVNRAGSAAWSTFAGYTRGIIVVAASNAVLVLIVLIVLRVPLALPLSLLVFFGTFIPIIGAPVALLVAAVVAVASRGPVVALIVVALVVVIGQIEGHLLQPLVMSRAVSLHPLAVALVVAAGTILAGVIGAVLAVPVASVLHAVIKEISRTAEASAASDVVLRGTESDSGMGAMGQPV
jgi:predicted PurR-regulated permease PerM